MHGAQEPPTRDPALEVAEQQARLRHRHLTAGRLAASLDKTSRDARRAADGRWQRDRSVRSGDASVQTNIAVRPGWMSSSALTAGSHEGDDFALLALLAR